MIIFDITSGDLDVDEEQEKNKAKKMLKQQEELKYQNYLKYQQTLVLEIVPVEVEK